MTLAEQYAACWGNRSLTEWDSVVGHGVDRRYYPSDAIPTQNAFQLKEETFYAYLPDQQDPQSMIETAIFTRKYQYRLNGNDPVIGVIETTLGGEV